MYARIILLLLFRQVALNRKPNDCREVSDCVTITIKTKGRLPWAKQLIESAWLRYPRIKCVVADELDANETDYFRSVNILPPGVIYLKTTPGVGFGRKLALMAVETKYALVVDDDFVFTANTNLTKMVDLLERSSADIVGGRVIDHSVFEGISRVADRYESGRYHPTQTSYAGAFFEKVPLFDSCFVCDRVKNFFLADRQVVLAAGSWDESRPFFEHEDFFVQMRRSGVTVVFCRDVVVYHNSTDRQLEVLRLPYLSPMTKHYLHKWGLTAVYECNRNMYTEQTCCDRCKRIGPSVSFDDNSPTIAFDQTSDVIRNLPSQRRSESNIGSPEIGRD